MNALVLRIALAALACLQPDGASAAQPPPMVLAVGPLPGGRVNPHDSAAVTRIWMYSTLYDTLTHLDRDGKLLPWLAESWVQESPTRWLITMRSDVKFSNGKALTSADVVKNLDYLHGEGKIQASSTFVAGVTSAKAVSPRQVRLETREPDALLPQKLGQIRIAALPNDAPFTRDALTQSALGTGPYVLENWGVAKATFKAAGSWRRAPTSRLEAIALPDATARRNALATGVADYAAAVFDFSDFGQNDSPKYVMYVDKMPAVVGLAYNTVKEGPFRDIRVRRALTYAVNAKSIVDAMFAGHTTVATQPARREFIGYNPDLKPAPYDPDKARALLAEAGYAKGFSFSIVLQAGGTVWDQVFQLVAADLAKVGVKMSIRMVPDASYQEMLYSSGFKDDAFGTGFTSPTFDAAEALRPYNCNWPVAWYCDPAADIIQAQAFAAPDLPSRIKADQALMARSQESAQAMYLYDSVSVAAHSRRLKNFHSDFGFIRYELITVDAP